MLMYTSSASSLELKSDLFSGSAFLSRRSASRCRPALLFAAVAAAAEGSVTVLEKTHEIGGVWSENYVGFGIQTPVGLSPRF